MAELAPVEAPPATTQSPPLRMLLFVALFFGGWAAVWGAVPAALLWRVVPGGGWTLLAAFLAILAPVGVLIRGFHHDAYPGAAVRLFVMRPFWYAQLALPFLAIGGLAGALAGWPFGAAGAWGRATLAVTAIGFALAIAVGYAGSRRLVVRRVEFAFPDLPAAFDGATIAQLSDLHVGPHTPRGFLRRIAAEVEAAKPDLIAFTGDQVDDFDRDVEHFARAFGHLRAPLGVFAIAGNHDVYAGWAGVRKGMEAAGMRVLVNDAERVARGGAEIWVAGTGDPAARDRAFAGGDGPAPDVARTLARIPAGAFTLALAHNPALWPALAARGVALTLSGHTHHGQVSIPALKWCLASPFLEHAMGDHALGASRLYINPGTNYWGVPLRIGAWPEVTIVTLRSAPERGN